MRTLAPVTAVVGLALAGACARTVVVTPEPGPGRASSVHVLGVPPGHLPRPGMCRVWIPEVPPGRQARARPCAGILAAAPAGSWILYRPSRDRRLVHVRLVHRERAGVLVTVRLFEASSGRFVSEREPGRDDEEADDDDRGRGRGRRP